MAGRVRRISSALIQAATRKAAEIERVELTPWDLQLLPHGPIQKGLAFPKSPKTDDNTLIHHLKTSFAQTLDRFPPLAGRLAYIKHEHDDDDGTISFFIDCNNAGALFIHAQADEVTVSDIVESLYVPNCIIHSFFPLNGLKNYEGVSNPLLGVQVTQLVDGVFIGFTTNHSVVDGTSFWHFVNSWSEISRLGGNSNIHYLSSSSKLLPVFHRSLINTAINYPIRIPLSLVLEKFGEEFTVPEHLKARVFHFTKQSIAKLKAKANAEVGAADVHISSLQALLAHIWRSVIRSKRLYPDEVTTYNVLVGARPRLPGLTEQYFGNAVKCEGIKLKAKEVQEQGLGDVAWQLNRMIAMQTEQEFKMELETWIASPKLFTMAEVKRNALVTSSSPRFNMYGNDFGWGKPIAVRNGPANKFDGKITVSPGAEEGSIDIEACLLPQSLDALAIDQEFLDTITT